MDKLASRLEEENDSFMKMKEYTKQKGLGLCGRALSESDMRQYLKKANSKSNTDEVDIVMKCQSSDIENRYSSC